MVLIERAARNNAVWCDAVCESHGAPGAFSSACWSARGEPPPFYPSVVTLNARDIRAQKAEIAAARDANANGCAVKDSFATLDLSDLGFRVLIEGSWIRHEAKADKPDETIWTRIGDQENLSAWERAWRGGGLDGAEPIFLNPLLTRSDIAIFAAAVADWRVASEGAQKLKKTPAGMPPLQLVENPDILATISKLKDKRPPLVIGFAAETEHLIDNAKAKIKRKGCDWIVANDVSPATGVMGGDRNTVHLLTRDGDGIDVDSWPVMSKEQVASELVARIARQVGAPT